MPIENIVKYIREKRLIFILSLTAFIVIIGFFSILNRAQWEEPSLGLEFTTDETGFIYLHPERGKPPALAGVQDGDRLLQIEGIQFFEDGSQKKIHWRLNDRFKLTTTIIYKGRTLEQWIEKTGDVLDLEKIAFLLDENASIRLLFLRGTDPPHEVSYLLSTSAPDHQFEYFYLAFIGLLTLITGVFVIFARKPQVSGRLIFYFFTLLTFILFVYSYTTDEASFSTFIFAMDIIARNLFAAVFLHFIVTLIWTPNKRKIIASLIYALPVVLLGMEAFIFSYNKFFSSSPKYTRKFDVEFILLQKIELGVIALYFLTALAIAGWKMLKTRNIILKKQLKFIFFGILGALPLTLIYSASYISGLKSELISVPAGMLFILFPISLAYASIRYKLMDLELQVLRSLGYVLSLTTLLVIYFLSVFFIVSLFPDFETEALIVTLGLFTFLLAVIYEPLLRRIKNFLDKIVYRDSYDFRKTLGAFSREFSSEHNLKSLLYNILQRLSRTFTIKRAAAFLYDEEKNTYQLEIAYPEYKKPKRKGKKKPLINNPQFSKVFTDHLRLRKGRGYILEHEQVLQIREEFYQDQEVLDALNVDYIIPLHHSSAIPAIITLSAKTNGDLLTTEDIELLKIIQTPAAIACLNAILIETIRAESDKNFELMSFNKSILESIHGCVVVVDRTVKVIDTNTRFNQLFGRKPSEITGKKLQSVLPRDFSARFFTQIDRTVFSEGKDFTIYKMPYMHNNEQNFFNITLSAFPREKKASGHVIVFNDITDEALMEEHLFRTDKLASLGMLAAGMAHEVNTPLTGISSYIQMLLKDFKGNKDQAELLKKVDKQAERIKNLVGRLLNFSRPGEVQYSEVSINEVIMDTFELFGKQMEKSGIEFEFNLDKSVGPVYGDYIKLQQVLTNLLINARDAIRDRGTIKISTKTEDREVFITIQDDGMGISEENLRKIYDPFFSTKKDRGGTGLGLSISYAIIREHLGTISVRSRIKEGTTFLIRLPIIRMEADE